MPISRAGKRRRNGKRLNSVTTKGGRGRSVMAQHVADDALLHEELHRLHHLGRPFAPRLHLGKQLAGHAPLAQRLPENIGGGDRVLNGEIDADAADRRHGVGRIADAEQPRPATSA